MTLASRRFILQGALFGVACACAAVGGASAQTPPAAPGQKYTCPPCGCAADGKQFDAPGNCPECGMPLVLVPADKTGAPSPPKLAAAQTSAARTSAARNSPAKPQPA
jgi:hypothetical protein